MQLKVLIKNATTLLQQAGILTAALDARLLFYHSATVEPLLNPELEVDSEVAKLYNELIQRRIKREPVAKIIGSKGFWSSDFYVNSHVLDPRPDSEVIIEETLKLFPSKKEKYQFLDLGTGTGCLILSLLKEFPKAFGIASDISSEALKVTKINVDLLKLNERVSLIQQNWADSLKNKFDLIVSNPPYIPSKDILNLEPEVKNFDPMLALDGGEDGLTPYRYLAIQIAPLLKSNACAILEFGYDQGKEVKEIFIERGYIVKKMLFDLSGIERAIVVSIN